MPIKTVKGDIWDYQKQGYLAMIPTNMIVKKDVFAVMEAGLGKLSWADVKKLIERVMADNNFIIVES